MAMSTSTAPGFIWATVALVTSLGALANQLDLAQRGMMYALRAMARRQPAEYFNSMLLTYTSTTRRNAEHVLRRVNESFGCHQ